MATIFPDELATRLADLCREHLRAPATIATDDATGAPILDFDPPLTAQEQVTLADLTDVARSPVDLTTAEWQTIRPHLQTIRDFRQLGRNGFMALPSDAERFRRLYDVATARTAITLALVRSS